MGARRRRAATTGMDRQEGATCMDSESREEVRDAYLRRTRSISPTGLSLSLSLRLSSARVGERDSPGQDQAREKETEGNHNAQHHHSQRKREACPSFKRLETRRLLVQSLLFTSQRHNHTDILFNFPLPPMITRVVPLSPPSLLPRRPPRVLWFSAAGGAQGTRWVGRGFVRLGSAGITYITLTRSGFEYCSGSWVIRVPFVGKMGSRDGGEWGARTGQASLCCPFLSLVVISLHTACSHFVCINFPFLCCFYFFLILLRFRPLVRSPGIAMDGMEME